MQVGVGGGGGEWMGEDGGGRWGGGVEGTQYVTWQERLVSSAQSTTDTFAKTSWPN